MRLRRKTFNKLFSVMAAMFTLLFVFVGSYRSAQKSLTDPTTEEVNEISNVPNAMRPEEQKTLMLSRRSAVQVMSYTTALDGISAMSGTFIHYEGEFYVLTASHGITGPCRLTQIVAGNELFNCLQFVLRDQHQDYMVMKVEEITNRTAVELPASMPNHSEWVADLAIQSTVYYTGYPNRGGPYTFDGKIVAFQHDRAIYIDSYGWSGSSGAGVFSASGNLIGWVAALDMGETMYGRQVLENFIWVMPLYQVEWPAVWALTDPSNNEETEDER